jgi:dolichol-phosphate mannosyltransferase
MNVSVIVPVKNEAENVANLFHEIQGVLSDQKDLDYEIIYVDDGSTDQTSHILQELATSNASLRLLRHISNCGQSTAVLTGVLHAVHDYIIVLDGDGQNNPVDIPEMMQLFADARPGDKLGLVMGNRVNRQDSVIRKISSRIANSVRAGLLNDSTPDSGCGLKMIPRSLFLRLPFFDHMHRFMPALVIRQGYKVKSIPITHRQRLAGTSKYGIHNRLWVGIIDLFGTMWLIRRMQQPQVKEMTGKK